MDRQDSLSKFSGGIKNETATKYLSFKDYDINSDTMPKLSREQISYIGTCLEDHHAIFSTFWALGNISFSKSIPTAAVNFERDGSGRAVNFVFNPDFWQELSHYDRMFIICHECLHIVFKHGKRMMTRQNYENINKTKEITKMLNHQITNIALDLPVNHSLVNRFGFFQKNIKNWNKYSWVDTVFPGQNVPDSKYFEYYMGELYKNAQKIDISSLLKGIGSPDDHGSYGYGNKNDEKSEEETNQEEKDILEKINKLLNEDEKKDIEDILNESNKEAEEEEKNNKDKQQAKKNNPGTQAGNKIWTFKTNKNKAKKTWKYLVKKVYLYNKHVWGEDEQWIRPSRRNALLSRKLILPSANDTYDSKEKQKVNAWVFLDVSGSCDAFVSRFWDLTTTIPDKLFKTRLFSFDTQTHEIINGKILGGGGTAFDIVENMIQKYIRKERTKYPHVVIMITDGCGNQVNPQYPDRWHWIMPDGSNENYIHTKSHKYRLEDFE